MSYSISRPRLIGTSLAFMLALIVQGTDAQAREIELEKDVEITIDIAGAQRINIDFSVGEVEIQNGPPGQIKIEGGLKVKGRNRGRVEEALEELDFEIETGEEILVTLPKSGRGLDYRVDLVITLPAGLELDIELAVGTLKAEIELPEEARFELHVGEIELKVPEESAAEVKASAHVGDVDIRGFDEVRGDSRRRLLVGAKFNGGIGPRDEAAKRHLELNINVGSVSLRGV